MTYEQMYRDNVPFVWRVLRRLGVHEPDVADVCHEVFLAIHPRFETFEGRSSTRTWIYGFCRNKAAEYRRKCRRRREDPGKAPEPSLPEHQTEAIQHRQAVEMLDEILDGLDSKKREIFVLFELEELPMKEVAEVVDCPLQTAYNQLYAARKYVEEAIKKRAAIVNSLVPSSNIQMSRSGISRKPEPLRVCPLGPMVEVMTARKKGPL